MSYTDTIPSYFPNQFSTNWEQEVQQTQSKLAGTVTPYSFPGTQKKINFIQKFSGRALTGRMEQTNIQEIQGNNRWLIKSKGMIDPPAWDEWDATDLAQIAMPKGEVIMGLTAEYNRQQDAEIIASISRAVYYGDNAPTSSSSLPAANTIAHGSAALTLAKVSEVIRKAREADVFDLDGTEFYGVISGLDEQYLINNVNEIRSIDYSAAQPIDGGTIFGKKWMGINWLHSSQLTKDTTTAAGHTIVDCLFYSKNCIYFDKGERKVAVESRPDLNGAMQIRTSWMHGALRARDEGAFVVKTYY